MSSASGRWSIEVYRTARGTSPVEEYLTGLPAGERARVFLCLKLLEEYGTRLSMPHARRLKGHHPLWELRPSPHRIIYFARAGRRFVLLHAFSKKKWKTEKRHIETAERRMHEVLERES